MADIFREVDEEVRKERIGDLWKRYGSVVIALVTVVILGVAGYKAWTYFDQQRKLEQAEAFAAALALEEAGQSAEAAAAFAALADDGDKGYPLLATFHRARLLFEAGDTEGAIALWDQVARSAAAGPGFQGVATLLSVRHQIGSADPAALRARLEPMTSEGSAFRSGAMELLAVLALEAGDNEEALNLYREIADDLTAPPGLRARAAQMLAVLGE